MKTLNFFYINFKNYHNKFSEICGNDDALLHKFDANRVSSFKKLWFYWQSIYIHLNVHRKQFIQIQQCFQMLPGTILEKCSFSALSLDFSACLSTKLRLSRCSSCQCFCNVSNISSKSCTLPWYTKQEKYLNKWVIFITQTNTGIMVKRVPQEQMFVIEATLLENHFLPSSGFVMLMSVEDNLISLFL